MTARPSTRWLARGAAALLWSLALPRCASISSAEGGSGQRVGDVWFVRTSTLFGLMNVGSSVWYCPAPPQGTVETTCTEASLDDDDDTAPSSAPAADDVVAAAPRCGGLHLDEGATVSDQSLAGDAPAGSGGAAADGRYTLTRYEWYSPSAQHTRRTTLLLREGRFEMAYARDDEPERQLSGAVMFHPDGRLEMRVECPRRAALEFDRYAVTDRGILLISTAQRKVATFARPRDDVAPPAPSPAPLVAPAPVTDTAPAPALPVDPAPDDAGRHGHRRHHHDGR